MRDLMVFGAMLMMLPLALSSAFSAYLLWCWAGVIALDNYLYGFMQLKPYVQIFAITTLVLILIKRDASRMPFKITSTSLIFILFGIHALFVATFALEGLARNWEIFSNIVKTLLFCLLMPMLVTNRQRMHALVLAFAIGLSFHGILDGLKFILSGGGHIARGMPKFGDNNYLAMLLVSIIPLFLYLHKYTVNKHIKIGFLATVILIILAVIATRSRGGLVTLIVVGLWILWHSKRKVVGVLALVFSATIVTVLAPADWTERMSTIESAESDSSFMTRVAVWKKSTAIALDHPIFGAGFYAVQSPATFNKYRYSQGLMGFIDTPDPFGYAAHSIYFQVMGDMGFLGFFIYLCMLANAFATRREILRLARNKSDEIKWATDLAEMLTASIISFMVGGALLSAAYFETIFISIALLESTKQIFLRDNRNPANSNMLA